MLKLSYQSLFRLYLGFALFTFLIPWPLAAGSQVVMSPDIAAIVFLCIALATFVLHPKMRIHRGILAVTVLLLVWQVWMTVALMVNPDRTGAVLLFRIFKRAWLFLPCILVGYKLAQSSLKTKQYFLSALLIWSAISATTGIIQTVSHGRLLTGVLTNRRFLGFLTPLPEKRYEHQDLAYQLQQAESGVADSAFYIGTIFRAHGPFEEPNGLTAAITPMTCFVLGLLFSKWPSFITKRRLIVFFLIFLLAQIASFGAAGIFALVFVGMRIFWHLYVNRWRTTFRWLLRPKNLAIIGSAGLIIMILLLIVAMIVFMDPSSVLAQRIDRITNPTSNEGWIGRVRIWAISFDYIRTSPWFGIGRLPTQLEYGISWLDTAQAPMNTYVTVGLLTGLPSQFLFVAIVVLFMYASWHVYKTGETDTDRAIGFACHLYFISLIVIGLVYDWVFFEGVAYLFFVLGGWCIATWSVRSRARPRKNIAPQSSQNLSVLITDITA